MTRLTACTFALAAGVMFMTGCEDNTDVRPDSTAPEETFRLQPAAINIGTNLTPVVLEVIGGQPPFRWDMSDPAITTLSGTNGFSRFATYAPLSTNRAVNTIRVRDAAQWRATTVIGHGL